MRTKLPFITRLLLNILLLLLIPAVFIPALAQLVRIEPANAGPDEPITLIFDASQGNGELEGASKVYLHSGVVTDKPDGTAWTHVVGNWGNDDGVGEMTRVEGETDQWQISMASAREYYGVSADEEIFRLSMVFRDAAGENKGSIDAGNYDWGFVASSGDIYLNLATGPYIQIISPEAETKYVEEGGSFTIEAKASEEVDWMAISVMEDGIYQEKNRVTVGQMISYEFTPANSGELMVRVNGEVAGVEVESSASTNVVLRAATEVGALPAGLRKGINYHEADPSRVSLVLEAPGKAFAYLVGDFNNWQVQDQFQMKQTPDGELFWLEIADLEPGQPYVFQYWIEDNVKVSDPYTDQVADPWNDQYIPDGLFPNMPSYTREAYGIASVLQTNQQEFVWDASEESWERPAKKNLVIYELLLKDFLASHSYTDLTDTLSYLKRLGVNAIELMPIMEFEGNESWGYNTMYHFAPDKYYGTKDDLKRFVEAAHQQGMAVILDMVLNHAFGLSPLVKMYWDPANNTVSQASPWFNPEATHPFNVGFDFNHESPYTQNFVDSVNTYWMEEYHFDGFRFDLSKGFTQTNNPDNVSGWSAYDASRIAILTRMADRIWEHSPNAYVILEHFADNKEEKELAAYRADEGEGMMLWGNLNHAYNQNSMGYSSDSDFSWIDHGKRNWSQPHVIGYMESHDEERMMYRNLEYGNSEGTYDVTALSTALNRQKAAGLLFYTLPGPKMIWQFGELGYDYSINYCPDGSIADGCRLANKPIEWEYADHPQRQGLYAHTADLLRLRRTYEVFTTGTTTFQGNSSLLKQVSLANPAATTTPESSNEMNVHMVANFNVSEVAAELNFPHAGTWYDYYAGGAEIELGAAASLTLNLKPGSYKLYTDYQIESPIISGFGKIEQAGGESPFMLFPNPTNDFLYLKTTGKAVLKLKVRSLQGAAFTPQQVAESKWDISSLAPGLYVVEIEQAGKVYFSRIIKK